MAAELVGKAGFEPATSASRKPQRIQGIRALARKRQEAISLRSPQLLPKSASPILLAASRCIVGVTWL
jgi:hypothetical protein